MIVMDFVVLSLLSPVVMIAFHEGGHFVFAKLFNVGISWKFVKGDSLFLPIRLVWEFGGEVTKFKRRVVAGGGLCGPLISIPIFFYFSFWAGVVNVGVNFLFLFSYMVWPPSTSPDFDDFWSLRF